VYLLVGAGGNIAVQAADEGVLVVDTVDIDIGFPTNQAPDDVVVEVFVGRESQHEQLGY